MSEDPYDDAVSKPFLIDFGDGRLVWSDDWVKANRAIADLQALADLWLGGRPPCAPMPGAFGTGSTIESTEEGA